jgi:dihydrofolate synthase/folylpolyglutamate synthase
LLYRRAALDVWILEVGLGGRLDAVSVIDADVAVITSIAIDHIDYLGGTRESIGYEKAGILRPDRPGICADPDPPPSVLAHAGAIGAKLARLGTDFGYAVDSGARSQWQFWTRRGADVVRRHGLPVPALRGAIQFRNAAAALAALDALGNRLPVTMGAIREGLVGVTLPARFQILPGRPAIVLDVAHNVEAAQILASNLGDMGFFPNTVGVFSMLADKDIAGVAQALAGRIDRWVVAPSAGTRGASGAHIAAALATAGVPNSAIAIAGDVAAALATARDRVGEADRIDVFGSFVTIAAAQQALAALRGSA